MRVLIIILGFLLNISAVSGQNITNSERFYKGKRFNHDTLDFIKYKIVICDSNYAPFASRNIFPKNRFKPSIAHVDTIENNLKKQYSNAERLYFNFSFENIKNTKSDYTSKEFRKLKRYYKKSNISKIVKGLQDRFEKNFCDFDREYYGYIGANNKRYIRIIFVPHEQKFVDIPGTGEAILDNLPNLTYNLDSNILYLAGWTGEKDE